MPLYRTYSEGEFLLGIWKSDETTEQLLASLEHKDWYREKLAVLSEKRKHEWLSVRVLLKALWRRKGDSLLLFGKALSKGWKPVYQHLAYSRLCGGGASFFL